jgi:integrase/recombinase XerD
MYAAMNKISYHLINYRGKSRILLRFSLNKIWNERIKKVPDARWSSTLKGWHIPDTEENRKKCGLEPATALSIQQQKVQTSSIRLSANNKAQLLLYLEQLALKKYSRSTLQTYRNEFMQLLQLLGDNQVQDLTPEHLKRYMLYCVVKLQLSENTLHSRLNALKFYFEQVLKREKFFWEIPRPKRPLQLPKLLNEEELRKLFNALTNKKHKAMLFTAYSAGLRVSEIVHLKIKHIDSKRMQIFIERAKGKKDRYVNLSPVLLDILRNYIAEYKPKPTEYLFESEQTFTAYPTRTVQQIFAKAKQKAGILKDVGIHSLRHSFATHLLDKGTDIKYIKDLLGHFDIRTTERYLHVSKQKLVNIISPLDDLMNEGGVDW